MPGVSYLCPACRKGARLTAPSLLTCGCPWPPLRFDPRWRAWQEQETRIERAWNIWSRGIADREISRIRDPEIDPAGGK